MAVGTSAHGSGTTCRWQCFGLLSSDAGFYFCHGSDAHLSDRSAVLLSFAAALGGERGHLQALHVLHQRGAHNGHGCYPPIQVKNCVHVLREPQRRSAVSVWTGSHSVMQTCSCMYLGYCSCRRSHVFSIDEDVHGVITAPLHTHTVPNLRTSQTLFGSIHPKQWWHHSIYGQNS